MNPVILFYVLCLYISCNTTTQSNNMEGVFTSKYEHEFGKIEDTLQLKKLSTGSNYFEIVRQTGVIRKMEQREFPKELKADTWKLEYDDKKKVFTETKTGKTIIWDESKQVLILGNREYSKK